MNKQNFKRVLDHIKAHPETWDQRNWHCGTRHCFFGWAQILSGKAENQATIVSDVREWLDLNMSDAIYLYDSTRTLEDFEVALNDEYSDTGFDKDGYNRFGYDREGYNQCGFDATGFDRNGYDRRGFGRGGRNRDGYDSCGLDRNNKPKPVAS